MNDSPARDSHTGVTFRITTMDCPSEESEIRRALESVPGVRSLRFQLTARTLTIDASEATMPQVLDAIRRVGFDPKRLTGNLDAQARSDHSHEGPGQSHVAADDHSPDSQATQLWRYAGALGLAIVAESLAFFGPQTTVVKSIGMALAMAAIVLAGTSTYRKGFAALRHGRLNINALMSVAVTGAFLIGQWPEAAMVMALYAIAELIEARAVDRARNAITGLLALTPDTAQVRQLDSSWLATPAAQVPIEAIVRVAPGERIPLDGVVSAGRSSVDQAPVTGESIPVDKEPGDAVFAGTINTNGMLEFRVTALASDTTVARIIRAVEQAQGTRAPTQRFVDRFAAIYTPLVFALAVLLALLSPWLMGWSWADSVYKALVLLVIACPCALVIATPVTVVSALAAAAKRGILIKGGLYLEGAHRLKAIALDKTGTVTEGKPRLVATEIVDETHPAAQVQHWAAALAGHSDHPVSRAIAQGLDSNATGERIAIDFTALPGRGIEARIDGQLLMLGNHRLIEERNLCTDELEARLGQHEENGHTVTILATDTRVLALYAVADSIKSSSQQALRELRALGVEAVMLTGDNPKTAAAIAQQAGISDARGNLLPHDKLAAIEDLQHRHGFTAMVGDGINDAPALARADIGIAMGAAGTDTAMESADIVIMNDDLRRIPETIRLSRRTRTVLRQNIALALGIKSVFLILAIAGSATMWMAVFADMGASLIVVFNGLRLLRPGVPSRFE